MKFFDLIANFLNSSTPSGWKVVWVIVVWIAISLVFVAALILLFFIKAPPPPQNQENSTEEKLVYSETVEKDNSNLKQDPQAETLEEAIDECVTKNTNNDPPIESTDSMNIDNK